MAARGWLAGWLAGPRWRVGLPVMSLIEPTDVDHLSGRYVGQVSPGSNSPKHHTDNGVGRALDEQSVEGLEDLPAEW